MNRIRELRQAREWSQRELAEKVHIPQSLLSDMELGVRIPWLRAAQGLAQAFGVPVSVIFPEGVPLREWKRKQLGQVVTRDE